MVTSFLEAELTGSHSSPSWEDADSDRRYRALFEAMSEGFALTEPIWNSQGKLTDYRIVEINPALQQMLGVGPEVVGRRLSEGTPPPAEWLAVCERAMKSQRPVSFEYANAQTGRWHEIRLTRVADDRLAQFFFDVTERKEALEHNARLFDELNHRVKNSLTMVSGLLQMQAKQAPEAVQDYLAKAVARVEAIADVHGALYRGGRSTMIDFAPYLRTLCDRLSASLADDGRVRLEVRASSAEVSVDHAGAMGMIVNELVTNAVKHAYSPPKRGVVDICFERRDGTLILAVADNGPGPPAGMEEASEGLGVRLVGSLAKQLGATVHTEGPPGARFTLRLPAGGQADQS